MENASTALLIAGGILFAILILSMGVLACSAITDFQEQQATQELNEEIKAFNESFLAYNKTRLFGTDVISIVNKAIYNNKKFDSKSDEPFYINIIIETKDAFKTTGKVTNDKYAPNDKNYETAMTDGEIKSKTGKEVSSIDIGTWKLGTWNAEELKMNQGIISFFSQSADNQTIIDGKKTYYIYSALTNFKTSIFKCTDVKYNAEGRIIEMTFEQI